MGHKDYDHNAEKWRNGPSGRAFGSKQNVSSANSGQPSQEDKRRNGENRNYDEQDKSL